MKNKLIVLSMEVKLQKSDNYLLNEVQLRALLAGLGAAYSEAAIWLTKKNCAVMVVGERGELLVQALLHFKDQFTRIRISYDGDAEKLLNRIADGKEWRSCTPVDKLIQLDEGQRLAMEAESLGPILNNLIDATMLRLKQGPILTGNRNSWKYSTVKSIRTNNKNAEVLVLKDAFYRFAIN